MPIPPHIQKLKEQLLDAIQPEDDIAAVYLFGSFLKKDYANSSDVDLAFLVDEKKYVIDPVKAVSPVYIIAARIGMALDMETDVTILNAASLEIAYETMTTGKCIYDTDQDKRLEYECKIKGMYFDFMPFIMELRLRRLDRIHGNSRT